MDLYPSFIHKGDLSLDSFGSDVDHICNEIQAACKGFGTDEKYVDHSINLSNRKIQIVLVLTNFHSN